MSYFLKLFVSVSGFLAGFFLLSEFGMVLNTYLPWSFLTDFFIILRNVVSLVDFMIDTDTLFNLVGIGILVLSAYYLFKAGFLIINWIKRF